MKLGIKIIFTTVCFFSLISCFKASHKELVLFDFESDADLDRLYWRCHTLFSLSDKNVAHGIKSLRMELYPSDYPGITTKFLTHDWSKYKTFSFDIYNPGYENASISVRMDDKKDYPSYNDRYNKTFILKPGLNHLSIPLNALITSGTLRSLDLKQIHRFLIFMKHPQKKFVLYIDYIHLA